MNLEERLLAEQQRITAEHQKRVAAINRRKFWMFALIILAVATVAFLPVIVLWLRRI